MCKLASTRLIQITDGEWINQQELVKSRLLSTIGKTTNILHARKCKVVIVDAEATKIFQHRTHIQGFVGFKVSIGLKFKGELVCVMTLGIPRYSNSAKWELLRFSSELNHIVVGGASKCFAHFIRNNPPTSVVTYSDRRWNTGGVYQKLGFEYSHTSQPNYQYFDTNNPYKLYHRSTFQKHKLAGKLDDFNSELTEWENMKNNGYDRIWDCGNDVYVFNSF